VWQAQDLVTLEHTNKAHDAVSVVKQADAWRHEQEMERLRKESERR